MFRGPAEFVLLRDLVASEVVRDLSEGVVGKGRLDEAVPGIVGERGPPVQRIDLRCLQAPGTINRYQPLSDDLHKARRAAFVRKSVVHIV